MEKWFGQVDISPSEPGAGQMDQCSPTPNGTAGNQTIVVEKKTRSTCGGAATGMTCPVITNCLLCASAGNWNNFCCLFRLTRLYNIELTHIESENKSILAELCTPSFIFYEHHFS